MKNLSTQVKPNSSLKIKLQPNIAPNTLKTNLDIMLVDFFRLRGFKKKNSIVN